MSSSSTASTHSSRNIYRGKETTSKCHAMDELQAQENDQMMSIETQSAVIKKEIALFRISEVMMTTEARTEIMKSWVIMKIKSIFITAPFLTEERTKLKAEILMTETPLNP